MPSTMTGTDFIRSTARQLASSPELALVQTVDAALSSLEGALRAANPRAGSEPHTWEPPAELRDRVAAAVIRQAGRLRVLLDRYQALAIVTPPSWRPRGGESAADRRLHVAWPSMSAEQASLLIEVLRLFTTAVREEHAGAIADLAARRAERAAWEADDEDDDLPF